MEYSAVSILLQIIFWLCVGAMVHTYVLYPLTLRLFRRRYARPPEMQDGDWPTAALLIPAYNEEKIIGAKVENVLALDYEPGRLQILVGSDGSHDRTNDIVRSYQDERLRLVELPGRSGKTGVLNRLVQETDAEVVIFTDANVMLDPNALRCLLRHFGDPKVGVAGGGKYIQIPEGAESVHGEALYGSYENRLRAWESAIGGMSGALGSLMAMRRRLFKPFTPGSTNDDTVPSIWATLDGYRNVYDPDAKAFEESGRSVEEEFRRRIRIGAGNFQTLFRYLRVLLPRYGVCAYTFFSHKVLRWIFPFLMLGALVTNILLLPIELYRTLFTLQLIGYGATFLGFIMDRAGLRLPPFAALYHFVALNIALLIGFFVYGRGITSSAWEPTARKASS